MSFELWKFVRGGTRVICRCNQNRKNRVIGQGIGNAYRQPQKDIRAQMRIPALFQQIRATFGGRGYGQARNYILKEKGTQTGGHTCRNGKEEGISLCPRGYGALLRKRCGANIEYFHVEIFVSLLLSKMPLLPSSRLRVLVAESNPRILAIILEMLKLSGHEGVGVDTAREVPQQLRTAAVDVLLIDIHLRDGSGIDLAKEAAASFPGLKVIFLTEFENQLSDKLEFPFACLPKPFYLTDLQSAVRRMAAAKAY